MDPTTVMVVGHVASFARSVVTASGGGVNECSLMAAWICRVLKYPSDTSRSTTIANINNIRFNMLNLFRLEIGVQIACCGWIHPQPPNNARGAMPRGRSFSICPVFTKGHSSPASPVQDFGRRSVGSPHSQNLESNIRFHKSGIGFETSHPFGPLKPLRIKLFQSSN